MKTLGLLLGCAVLAFAQAPQASDDPQSLAAVRSAVTRLNAQLLALTHEVSALNASTNTQFAGLQTALVPVGAVIDWYRPRADTPMPNGFMICNGIALMMLRAH